MSTTRRIATVAATAALAVAGGLLTAPLAQAAAPPAAPPGKPQPRQPAGPSAFTRDPFTASPSPGDRRRAVANARRALTAHRTKAHVASGQGFVTRTVVVDRNGAAHVRFDRTYQGLPVYGDDLVVHLKPGGSYRALETAVPKSTAVSTTPAVGAARAAATSRAQLKGTVTGVGKPRLAVYASGRSSQLVWETVVSGVRSDQTPSKLHVLVDGRKGAIVATRDEVHTLLSQQQAARAAQATHSGSAHAATALAAGSGRTVYSGNVSIDLTQSGSTWQMRDPSHGNGYTTNLNHGQSGTGTIYSNSTGTFGNNAVSDPASVGADAHYGAAMTWDYYKNVHGRSGIFGDARGVPSRTHYGNAYANAFWDGVEMTYGDGSNNQWPLVQIDVAGHEMTHGVSEALTRWSEPPGEESGGLNEMTSDIFGTMVEFYANNATDTPDYKIGELINIFGNNQPLRYMYQPSLDGASPDCWSAGIGGLDPHHSGGPLNHWFFLLAVGSGNHGYGNSPTCNNTTINGIGNDKAGKIWFRALQTYANSNEDFHQARTDSLKAAADLYGAHCAEYETVNAAWAAVDVTGTDPVPGTCAGQPGSPTMTSPGNQTAQVGTPVNLQVRASDPGGQTLTYSATGLPAGLSINATSGVISGTPTTQGTSNVTVTATNPSNRSGSASFTWTVNPAGGGTCTAAGDKVTNGGFENGTTPWTTSSGVIAANGQSETAHSGTHFAWLDGYGQAHTDTVSQQVTIPSGCRASLTVWVHIDTAETGTTAYDTATVKVGNTTLATYSNTDATTGYVQRTFDVSSYAGQTVTLSFSGTEDQSLQTSFVIDDVAVNAS